MKYFFVLKVHIYRPQRSWAKVIFSQASVCPQEAGVSASVHAGIYPPDQADPPGADTPPDQADTIPPGPGRPPPRPGRPPPDQADPARPGRPPREADFSIRSTSGRYASYWNAFLFSNNISKLFAIPDLEAFSKEFHKFLGKVKHLGRTIFLGFFRCFFTFVLRGIK